MAWFRLPTPRSAITIVCQKRFSPLTFLFLAAALDPFNLSHNPEPHSSLTSRHYLGFFSAVHLMLTSSMISSLPGVLTTPSSEVSQISLFSLHISSKHQPHVSNSGHLDFQRGWISQINMAGLLLSTTHHLTSPHLLLLLCSLVQWMTPAGVQSLSPETSESPVISLRSLPDIRSATKFCLSKSPFLFSAISCA